MLESVLQSDCETAFLNKCGAMHRVAQAEQTEFFWACVISVHLNLPPYFTLMSLIRTTELSGGGSKDTARGAETKIEFL